MSRLLDLVRTAAIGAAIILLTTGAAQAQEAQTRLPTIADCPPGYSLGVQDTAEPQPLAKAEASADPNNYSVAGAMAAYQAQAAQDKALAEQQAAAPRQFVTGCIPPLQHLQP